VQLQALAYSGSDALARRITPYGTLFDGDAIFAVITATIPPKSPLQVEAAGRRWSCRRRRASGRRG